MTTPNPTPHHPHHHPTEAAADLDGEEVVRADSPATTTGGVSGGGPARGPRSTQQPKWADPGVRQALIDGVRLGAPMRHVLRAARVSEQSFYNWRAQVALPDAPEELVELFDALEEAGGRAVLRTVGMLQAAAQDPRNWRAAAWWLERMHREEFGPPERGVEREPGTPTVVVASSEDIRRLQEALLARQAVAGELGAGGEG